MARIQYGHTISESGVLRYVSPSSLDLADHNVDGGCLRRWWFKYKKGIKEPETEQQKLGTRCHDEVATYLTTGVDTLGPIARNGIQHIPAPGNDLRVEWPVCPTPNLATSELTIGGVSVIGYGDCAHGRGENKIAYGEIERDPEGTLEIIDWKFVGDIAARAKTNEQVARATPMVLYGEALARHVERQGWTPRFLRLSHVYFQTKGRVPSAKRTRIVPRAEVAGSVEQLSPLVRSIVDAARAEDPNDVPGNRAACNAFRRDCIHRPYCSIGRQNSLAQVVGTVSAADLLRRIARAGALEPEPVENKMQSMLGSLITTPSAPPAAAPSPLAAQIAALKAEEIAAPPPPPPYTPEFAKAWNDIETRAKNALPDGGELGIPTMKSHAARALTALKNWPGNAAEHNGTGRLQKMTIEDPAQVVALAAEIVATFPMVAAAVGVVASAPPVSSGAPPVSSGAPPALLPPDAPVPSATISPPAQNAPAATPDVTDPKPKAKRGRKATSAPAVNAGSTEVAETDGGFELFVDAVPRAPYHDLRPIISQWAKLVCDKYAPGIADVRCAPNTTEIGYGKWKAVLGAVALEVVETGLISGRYYLDTRGSELAESVADALHDHIAARGVR